MKFTHTTRNTVVQTNKPKSHRPGKQTGGYYREAGQGMGEIGEADKDGQMYSYKINKQRDGKYGMGNIIVL